MFQISLAVSAAIVSCVFRSIIALASQAFHTLLNLIGNVIQLYIS